MLVANHFNIVGGKVVNVRYFRVELERWKRHGFPSDLELGLVQVIVVEMCIAKGVDKDARFQVADLGHHVREKGVGGDVERHAEEDVAD